MLVPKSVHGQLVMVDGSPFEVQRKLQEGCSCCGWQGDPYLGVYVIPKKYGDGYCIIHKQPGEKAALIWTSSPLDNHAVDHRAVDFVREARKNWELGSKIIGMMDAHDAKVERDNRRKEVEMNIEVSKMVGSFLRKNDMLPTKHKIDKKKA